jgi:CRP-like cAMP-binding protein
MASPPRDLLGDLPTVAFCEANVLVKALDPEARHDLLAVGEVQDYEAGELIAADAGDERIYLVREGRTAVLLERDGKAVEVAVLERGAFFGEGRVLGDPVAGALVARTEATVLAFPAPVLGALAERFPRVKKLLESIRAARQKDAAQKLGAGG